MHLMIHNGVFISVLFVVLDIVNAQNTEVSLQGTLFHQQLEGIYTLVTQQCNGLPMWTRTISSSQLVAIFYFPQNSYTGYWVVGKGECSNQGYMIVPTNATNPTSSVLKGQWGEAFYNWWVANPNMIVLNYYPPTTTLRTTTLLTTTLFTTSQQSTTPEMSTTSPTTPTSPPTSTASPPTTNTFSTSSFTSQMSTTLTQPTPNNISQTFKTTTQLQLSAETTTTTLQPATTSITIQPTTTTSSVAITSGTPTTTSSNVAPVESSPNDVETTTSSSASPPTSTSTSSSTSTSTTVAPTVENSVLELWLELPGAPIVLVPHVALSTERISTDVTTAEHVNKSAPPVASEPPWRIWLTVMLTITFILIAVIIGLAICKFCVKKTKPVEDEQQPTGTPAALPPGAIAYDRMANRVWIPDGADATAPPMLAPQAYSALNINPLNVMPWPEKKPLFADDTSSREPPPYQQGPMITKHGLPGNITEGLRPGYLTNFPVAGLLPSYSIQSLPACKTEGAPVEVVEGNRSYPSVEEHHSMAMSGPPAFNVKKK